MGAEQIELHDHRVLGVVQRERLVALIGKRRAGLREVAPNVVLAVIHVAGRDDLVAGMGECPDGRVEVVLVLRFHMLAHDHLAALAQSIAG